MAYMPISKFIDLNTIAYESLHDVKVEALIQIRNLSGNLVWASVAFNGEYFIDDTGNGYMSITADKYFDSLKSSGERPLFNMFAGKKP